MDEVGGLDHEESVETSSAVEPVGFCGLGAEATLARFSFSPPVA